MKTKIDNLWIFYAHIHTHKKYIYCNRSVFKPGKQTHFAWPVPLKSTSTEVGDQNGVAYFAGGGEEDCSMEGGIQTFHC